MRMTSEVGRQALKGLFRVGMALVVAACANPDRQEPAAQVAGIGSEFGPASIEEAMEAADAVVLATVGETLIESTANLWAQEPTIEAVATSEEPDEPQDYTDLEMEVDEIIKGHGRLTVDETFTVRLYGFAEDAPSDVGWPVEGRQYLFALGYEPAWGAYTYWGDAIWLGGSDVVYDHGLPVPYATGTPPALFLNAVRAAIAP